MPDIIVIGAGITGLSFAYHCKKKPRILERKPAPGGICGSVNRDGFTFDYAGHFLHLRSPYARRLFGRLMRNNLLTVQRNAVIHTHGVTIPYPFQAHLHALPAAVRQECLEQFLARPAHTGKNDFYSWSLATFGAGITRHFMRPYNEKLWTVSSRRLATDWVAPFVPQPTRAEIQAGADGRQASTFGYNVTFRYPSAGGCQAIVDTLAAQVPAIQYSCAVQSIDIHRRQVETSDGKTWHYDTLLSTQPLPDLLAQIHPLPAAIRAAARKLDWNSVTCLNLGISLEQISPLARTTHWVYFPEQKYPFYRAGNYAAAARKMAPAGNAALYVEISRRPGQPAASTRMIHDTLRGLRTAGILQQDAVPELIDIRDIPCAYVIYDRYRPAAVQTILAFLRSKNIRSLGRYGAWEYSFMEKSILDGRAAAEELS